MKKIGTMLIIIIIYIIALGAGKTQQAINVLEPTPNLPYQSFLPVISNELRGYFVSPNGSDSNPGTFLLPWKTIGKAAHVVEAGDVVYLRGGTYNESPNFTSSGTITAPIKIMAYPGEKPIIDGYNQLPPSYRGLLSIFGDWVQVSGLEIRNSKYVGLGLYGKHDVADHIFAHHSQKAGIYIVGDYGIVQYSQIWRNSLENEYGSSSNWSGGMVAGRDSDGLTEYAIIKKNIVWENWGHGIKTHESNGTIMEDNTSHDNFIANIKILDSTNVLFQRNFVYTDPNSYVFIDPNSNHIGIMIEDEGRFPPSANITIINNISYGNNWNFALFNGANPINNILIANNTFVNGIISGGVLLRGYHTNVRFENNIIQQDGTLPAIAITLNPEVGFSNNLWLKPPGSSASSPTDVIGDPHLAKTGTPYAVEWYKLTALSPAIDKARILPEVVLDYFTNPRGNNPDMGAIEYIP